MVSLDEKKLEEVGCEVVVPKFPTPEGQSLESWNHVFSEYSAKIDEDTVFIGHSLGPVFLLNVLESLYFKIKASFFVAGFVGFLGMRFLILLIKLLLIGSLIGRR